MADFQIGIGEDALGVFRFLLAQRRLAAETQPPDPCIGIFGKHRNVRHDQLKAGQQLAPEHRDAAAGHCGDVGRGVDDFIAVRAQLLGQLVCLQLVFHQDNRAVAAVREAAQVGEKQFVVFGIGDGMPRAEPEQTGKATVGNAVGNRIQVQGDLRVGELPKIGRGAVVFGVFSGNRSAFHQFGHGLVHVPFECLQAVAQRICRAFDHQSPPGEVIEQARLFLIDGGDILIQKEHLALAAQGCVHGGGLLDQFLHGVLAFGGAELCRNQLFQAFQRRLVAQQLARRLELGRGDRLRHALGVRFEQPHAVDVVTEQFNAQGVGAGFAVPVRVRKGSEGRVDVHNAAAQRKLPGAVDQVHPGKSRRNQPARKGREVDGLVVLDGDGVRGQDLRGDGVAKRGIRCGQDCVVGVILNTRKHLDALVLIFVRSGHAVKGEVTRHVEARAQTEPLQQPAQAHAVLLLRAEDERRPAPLACGILQDRDQQRIRCSLAQPAGKNRQRADAKILPHRAQQLPVLRIRPDNRSQNIPHISPFMG